MKNRLQQLWDETVPMEGPCPQPDPAAVRRRVNAALNAIPSERSLYMRQKLRLAALVAAAAVLLAGSALAAASHWNVLDFYFQGGQSAAQDLVDDQPRSVCDEQYTLTVESSACDASAALLLVRVDARTDKAAAFMGTEDFNGIDLWSIHPVDPDYLSQDSAPAVGGSFSYSEVSALRTETSTTWRIRVDLSGMTCSQLSVRMGYMEPGLSISVPLDPAQPVEVAVNASGQGLAWYETRAAGPVTLHTVSLTPLSLQMDVSWTDQGLREEAPLPPIQFRMADGTLRTAGQMLNAPTQGTTLLESSGDTAAYRGTWNLTFRSVQDLSQIKALVVWGLEYPLDGSTPRPTEEESCDTLPFSLARVNPRPEGGGYLLPVRALCEGLGIDCDWDDASHTAVMTYRGITLELTWGSQTARLDGQPIELSLPVLVQDSTGQFHTAPDGASGTLCVEAFSELEDIWQLWICLPYDSQAECYADSWTIWP
ncbi:copper amine oxidase N-terminal domain-containing protein [Flavonifractor hominis]|uniref:Copper amine oxidase N-terminal domain-containing protein n=1 Tax=Flavonifractor hominis TaxID=3133178 RepID=A0ABV1EMA5_9FIRM